MRGRIDELSRQLNNANEELRKLKIAFGQVTSYNEILVHENKRFQEEIRELKLTRKDRYTRSQYERKNDIKMVMTKQKVIKQNGHNK